MTVLCDHVAQKYTSLSDLEQPHHTKYTRSSALSDLVAQKYLDMITLPEDNTLIVFPR